MCFVCVVKATAKTLSLSRGVVVEIEIWKSWRRQRGRKFSVAAVSRAQYSTSVDDRATIFCFLVFQEIKLGPRNEQ